MAELLIDGKDENSKIKILPLIAHCYSRVKTYIMWQLDCCVFWCSPLLPVAGLCNVLTVCLMKAWSPLEL